MGTSNENLVATTVAVDVERVIANLDTSSATITEDLRALQRNWFLREYFKEKEKDKKPEGTATRSSRFLRKLHEFRPTAAVVGFEPVGPEHLGSRGAQRIISVACDHRALLGDQGQTVQQFVDRNVQRSGNVPAIELVLRTDVEDGRTRFQQLPQVLI